MPNRKPAKKKAARPEVQAIVRNLERDLERAIAEVFEQRPELPIGPDKPTMHFMAKAATAAYEAALNQLEAQCQEPDSE